MDVIISCKDCNRKVRISLAKARDAFPPEADCPCGRLSRVARKVAEVGTHEVEVG